jgi:hypothetical protein
VNPDDVLVGDLPGEQELTLEAPFDVSGGIGIRHDFRPDDFQCDGDTELVIPRLVHHTHSTGADLAEMR